MHLIEEKNYLIKRISQLKKKMTTDLRTKMLWMHLLNLIQLVI